jgi:hypothetical protein
MAQPTNIKPVSKLQIKGLFTNPSHFGENVPTGALTIADNVVIDRPSVVATRRGRDNQFSTIEGTTQSMFQFQDAKLAWTNYLDGTLYSDEAVEGTWVNYTGTFKKPDALIPGCRVRGLEQNNNFYFNTEEAVFRLDSPSGTPRAAGAPPGLQGTGVTTGATGFMPNNTNVAYRVVFGFKDANNVLVLGAPSSRIIVQNISGTTANVNLTFQLPQEVADDPTDWIVQVYRGNTTANISDEPDDDMALTFEQVVSTIVFPLLDTTPSTELGASLYTNAGEEGAVQANYRPPWCLDMALFEQRAFYANTRELHSVNLTLLASGALAGPDGLIPGDNINFISTVGSFTVTGTGGVNNPTLGLFNVSNTGNAAFDIQTTAYNICQVINEYPGNDIVTAYYDSGYNDRPGQMRFVRISYTEESFSIDSSHNDSFVQAMPVVSLNNARANRIYFSKPNQPEAVPLVNYFEVGTASQPINRILTLQNGIIVLKQDGVWRVSAGNPYQIQLIDSTARILAPNTAVVGDNKVWFLSDQGVVASSESDVEVMSFDLDNVIIRNTSGNLFPNLAETAWAIAYQSDRKYELWLPTTGIETQATQQYIYNYMVEEWTRWTFKGTAAMVYNVDGKMYYGSQAGSAPGSGLSYIYQERKSFTPDDYVDDEYITNNTTIGYYDTIVIDNPSLPSGVSLLPGWTIQQGTSGASARIVSTTVGMTQTTVVMDRFENWLAGDVSILVPVYCEVETIQVDCANPGFNKQFSEIVYLFTEQNFDKVISGIYCDTTSNKTLDDLIPIQTGGWGIGAWGSTPWGGTRPAQGKIRRYVPQAVQRAGWVIINLTLAQVYSGFGFSGFEMYWKVTSTRQF